MSKSKKDSADCQHFLLPESIAEDIPEMRVYENATVDDDATTVHDGDKTDHDGSGNDLSDALTKQPTSIDHDSGMYRMTFNAMGFFDFTIHYSRGNSA